METSRQERRKHIFVINNSPGFLDVVRELFQDEGYDVTTTNFVPNSYAQIAALQPDLLIVDVAAGERSGWDLLKRLHAETATTGIPVLVVSTSARLLERAQDQTRRYGNHRSLEKPFALDEILAAIEEMIGTA